RGASDARHAHATDPLRGSATGRQRESDLGEPGSATASARSLASGSRPPLADRAAQSRMAELLLGICLLTAGIVLVLVQLGVEIRLDVVLPALAVLGGVALAIAPWLLRLNRELIAERSGRAREAERAEIAAHLHDSVLQ